MHVTTSTGSVPGRTRKSRLSTSLEGPADAQETAATSRPSRAEMRRSRFSSLPSMVSRGCFSAVVTTKEPFCCSVSMPKSEPSAPRISMRMPAGPPSDRGLTVVQGFGESVPTKTCRSRALGRFRMATRSDSPRAGSVMLKVPSSADSISTSTGTVKRQSLGTRPALGRGEGPPKPKLPSVEALMPPRLRVPKLRTAAIRCDETFCTQDDLVCPTVESCAATPGWELAEDIIACAWELSLAVFLPRTLSDNFWPARLCELVVLCDDRSDRTDAFDRKVTDLFIFLLSFGLSDCWFTELCCTLHAMRHAMQIRSTPTKTTAAPIAMLLLLADVTVSRRVRFRCSGPP
mmetsp:Transcript_71211/g.185652  ORF Transcript_71211/g.185652 Transcript_71211/m.185652 type:complete len:346 (+) Transcript_71211:193-1230(+)